MFVSFAGSWSMRTAKMATHQQEIALGADLAWSGPSGGREGTKNPAGPNRETRRVQKKRRRQKWYDPEKECSELQKDIKSEEDPRAGTEMYADEETLSKEQNAGKDAGGEKQFGARPRRTTTASR